MPGTYECVSEQIQTCARNGACSRNKKHKVVGGGLKGKNMGLEPDGHIYYVALGRAATSLSSRFSSVGCGEHTMHGRK